MQITWTIKHGKSSNIQNFLSERFLVETMPTFAGIVTVEWEIVNSVIEL